VETLAPHTADSILPTPTPPVVQPVLDHDSFQNEATFSSLGNGTYGDTDSQGMNFEYSTDYDFDFPAVYEALNAWITPAALVDADAIASPLRRDTTQQPPSNGPCSVEQSKRVQKAWPRKRASAVVRMVRHLWRHAIEHNADNLFSKPTDTASPRAARSRWNMDNECRDRLMRECDTILLPAEKYSGRVTAPGSPNISMQVDQDVEVEGLSPQTPRLKFPSAETLDMSIDFYFRRFHPNLPVLHQATFDAKLTPSSLLLPMCLIGLSILNPRGAEEFVRQYLGKMIRYCRLDLTYKALGKGGAQQLLTSLASSLLVLYLGLSSKSSVDEHQAHMLAIQTLFIADRHGIFCAHETETLTAEVFQHTGSDRSLWTAWARVESLKRLILCLISIDSAFTFLLDLAGNIGLDRLEVALPCDSSLFDAPSAAAFFSKVESGSAIVMRQADLTKMSTEEVAGLTEYGLRVLLDVVALKEAVARHKVLPNPLAASAHFAFVPASMYAADKRTSKIAGTLVHISNTHQDLVRGNNATVALFWNHSCMAIMADLDRIQMACGRAGLDASQKSLTDLAIWASTASARRALLHAAQIFRVLTRYRVGDNKVLIHESLLCNAAMVMAIYVFVRSPSVRHQAAPDSQPLELLHDVDWSAIGDQGLCTPPDDDDEPRLGSHGTSSAAASFISNGGNFSFGGECYGDHGGSARKLVLNCAQLLDEITTRDESEHSHLLRTIGDFLNVAEQAS